MAALFSLSLLSCRQLLLVVGWEAGFPRSAWQANVVLVAFVGLFACLFVCLRLLPPRHPLAFKLDDGEFWEISLVSSAFCSSAWEWNNWGNKFTVVLLVLLLSLLSLSLSLIHAHTRNPSPHRQCTSLVWVVVLCSGSLVCWLSLNYWCF